MEDSLTPSSPGLRPRGPIVLLLGVALAALIGLIELGVLEFTWERLGIGHRTFGALLLVSLLGSAINVPLTAVGEPPERTVVAVNLGGAVVPTLLGLYLLFEHRLFVQGAIAIAVVAAVSYRLARPVPGVGIAVPIFLPPLTAAATALALAPDAAPALAYPAGSIGTLLGADLAHLPRIRELRSPLVSIGGAGTFDGVFVTGIIAVLLA